MKSRAVALTERVIALVEAARAKTVAAVNLAMVYTYYEIGRQIVEEEQGGKRRAGYGETLLIDLSKKLTARFGRGWSVDNLQRMRQFFLLYSHQKIYATPLRKLENASSRRGDSQRMSDTDPTRAKRINTVYPIPEFTLSWSHYLKLMRIDDPDERAFYEIESRENNWSLRELQRQFDSSLYERLALSRDKKKVMDLARRGQVVERPEDAVKDPYILEFTGLPERANYTESDLETKLIDHLQEFMLELGKGFAFVGRQQRITFDEKHFFVDLVFFNRLLKCFVLVDLKRGELKHQDIGQMQMYVNYYDRVVKLSDENPTIGILLCHDKNDTLVEFSLPLEGNRIFASKYKTVLPSKTQLKRLISKDLDGDAPSLAASCQLLCKTHNRAKGNR